MIARRILHCLRAPVGGLFRHVVDLAGEQAKRGHAVGILCDAGTGGERADEVLRRLAPDLALGVHRIAMRRQPGLGDMHALAATLRAVRRIDPDVLHGHGAKGGAYARVIAAWSPRDPALCCAYTPHGGTLHYSPSTVAGRFYLGFERWAARHTDAIIFESAYGRAAYERLVGVPPCRALVVRNGLHPQEFWPVVADRDAADLLFVGELRWLKGVDVLIEALALLREGGRACRTLVVGAGPDEQTFRALTASRGLEDCVNFLGARPAREMFPHAKMLIVPSRAESLPYVVLEAASAGIPVIASRVGGVSEILGEEASGLVPPDEPEILAAAIANALENPLTVRAEAALIRARLEESFSIAGMADDILEVYQRCLRDGRSGVAAIRREGALPAE